jgi:hypothetical protein
MQVRQPDPQCLRSEPEQASVGVEPPGTTSVFKRETRLLPAAQQLAAATCA